MNAGEEGLSGAPAARLLSYTTAHGDSLHAVLHLPAGYEPGHAYPTIVSIYERQSHTLHSFVGSNSPFFDLLRAGYAVLLPDIQPRLNEPGAAAVEAVNAAVDAAIATGAVDVGRLGIMGHSYGAFETCYIVSRSSRFGAAIAHAGMTNLISDYGALWNRGIPKSFFYDQEQPYMAGPWWQNWEAYVRNSPLFGAERIRTPLLLVHGDRDQAVPFSQSVELFNALRRMGNADVALLQYVGEDHTIEDAGSSRDLRQREVQFFDHFLKGAVAPSWWSGVD